MAPQFTLGVEEELQTVHKDTGQLVSHVHPILEKGVPLFGEHIKPEMLQSMVEIITGVCTDIAALRAELGYRRKALAQLVDEEGLALISAGTHPIDHWRDQERTQQPRYKDLEEEFQDVGRSILICGMHVHVGIENHEIAIPLMNQLRTWLPHLLALSSNSPFWVNRYTGIKSYRSIVWKRFPRSGVPAIFPSTHDFDSYIMDLVRTGCIDNAKRIWWDIRPHPFYSTIEFRICDMPGSLEDTLMIAALCQALVAKVNWLHQHNLSHAVLPAHYIDENKWRAARYGLDAEYIDFVKGRHLPLRDELHEMLDFVEDVVDDLGTRNEITALRKLINDPHGTGADRQIAAYSEQQNIQDVIHMLMQRTVQGLPVDAAVRTF